MIELVLAETSASWWDSGAATGLIALGSAVVGGLIGSVVGPYVQHRLGRRDRVAEAHLRAAQEHAERVASVHRTLDEIAYSVLGDEVGVIDPEGMPDVDEVQHAGRAIGLLRQLRSAHPTPRVREAAKDLEEELRGFYGNPPPTGTEGWPSYGDRDALLDHVQRAENLIELLHVAP